MDKCKELWVEQMSAEGMSQSAIARKLNVHPVTIGRVVNREDVKAKIEYCRTLIAQEAYAKSVANVIKVINEYDDPIEDSNDKLALQRKQHGFTASMRVAESIGVLPSNSMAPAVVNVLNIQNNNYVSPLVESLLKQSLNKLDNSNVIDSERDDED